MNKINYNLNDDDKIMCKWEKVLRDDLGVHPNQSRCIATTIFEEINQNISGDKLISAGDFLSDDRFNDLSLFINFTNERGKPNSQIEGRMHLLLWNYMCFVYLGDACFKRFHKQIPQDTVAWKCYNYLLQDKIRAFRNAIAHGNWKITDGNIQYWNRKNKKIKYTEYNVKDDERTFWCFLSLCTAKSTYAAIQEIPILYLETKQI